MFDRSVFVNCPFDDNYKPLLQALLFTVLDCGLEPCIASESVDSGKVRVEKVLELIQLSRFSIHDLSRVEPLSKNVLPRFNMPFELGLDLGCRSCGHGRIRTKQCLILEKQHYRYRQVLSDLSGNDIRAHRDDPRQLILEVRSWLRVVTGRRLSSASLIWQRFNGFLDFLSRNLIGLGFTPEEMQRLEVAEYLDFAREWIETQ